MNTFTNQQIVHKASLGSRIKLCLIVAAMTMGHGVAQAEDIDIYNTTATTEAQTARSNILFVLDTSGSMVRGVSIPLPEGHGRTNLFTTGPGSVYCRNNPNDFFAFPNDFFIDTELDNRISSCKRRNKVLREAMIELVDTENVDFGLARFNNPSVGGTVFEVIKTRTDPEIEALKLVIDTLPADGGTPLTESYLEAANYFIGGERDTGKDVAAAGDTNLTNNTDPEALVGGTGTQYQPTVIDNQCERNAIVVITDGLPNGDDGAHAAIKTLSGQEANYSCTDYEQDDGSFDENCMPELAEYLSGTDFAPSTVEGVNAIRTYTVGFGLDAPMLQQAAINGRLAGETSQGYFTADDGAALASALNDIITDVTDITSDTFTSASASVSAFNRLTFRDELYFALFKPVNAPRWSGNLKKYKLTSDGTIVGVDPDLDVVSEVDGGFVDAAQSFWSPGMDGNVVENGGAASQLSATRTLYADLGAAAPQLLDATNFLGTGTLLNLPDMGQLDDEGNTLSTADLTDQDVVDQLEANRIEIAGWALGRDVDSFRGADPTGPNQYLGDSIHSSPFVLSYGSSTATPEDIIFFVTNQGMVHAVNGANGGERWAYIPDQDLFENLGKYYNNNGTDHVYGIDGPVTFSIQRDAPTAATTGLTDINEAILYAGQRRGGSKYFAIDITNADGSDGTAAPVKKLFTVEGGTTGFERLGQTWSPAIPAKINYCTSGDDDSCSLVDVLIFSGGYDEAYDQLGELDGNDELITLSSLSGQVTGNAIYIVAAKDQTSADGTDIDGGQLLWKVSNTNPGNTTDLRIASMDHSIPSAPTAVDITGDGAVDTIFAVDVAGQVFRIDFRRRENDTNDVRADNNSADIDGDKIADLAVSGQDRVFFNPINITLAPANEDQPLRFILVTGSGSRPDPKLEDTNGNRFYVLFDENVAHPKWVGNNNRADYDYTVSGAGSSFITNLAESVQSLSDGGTADDTSDDTRSTNLNVNGAHEHGYWITLDNVDFEKVLQPTLLVDGAAFFTSYVPEEGRATNVGCSTGIGSSNVYNLDLVTGSYQVIPLDKGGISGAPVIVFLPETRVINGETVEVRVPTVLVGTESFGSGSFENTGANLVKDPSGNGGFVTPATGGGTGGNDDDPPPPPPPVPPCPDGSYDRPCTKSFPKALKSTWWEVDREN